MQIAFVIDPSAVPYWMEAVQWAAALLVVSTAVLLAAESKSIFDKERGHNRAKPKSSFSGPHAKAPAMPVVLAACVTALFGNFDMLVSVGAQFGPKPILGASVAV